MISVAEYLEEKGELEKAVQLYQKAGEVTKALDLCFRAGAGAEGGQQDSGGGGERNPAMFEALKSMMDDLGSHASPQVQCCFFFVVRQGKAESRLFKHEHAAPVKSRHNQSVDPALLSHPICPVQVLSRCVDFFIANGQFDKAVGLCITNQKYLRAIELCVAHKVGAWRGNKQEEGGIDGLLRSC